MALWKRRQRYWLDVVVHGHRYREPLGTTDWREAKRLERERVEQLQNRASIPSKKSLAYAAMDVATAIAAYADERRSQVSTRMVAYWLENARPLAAFFGNTPLRHITSAQIAAYQNARTESGRAAKTVNGEVSVLRQVLKRAKVWYRIEDEYTTIRNRKAPVGRALTPEQQHHLFAIAQTKPAWLYAYVAATLAFYCGLRACEIKGLRWQGADVEPPCEKRDAPPHLLEIPRVAPLLVGVLDSVRQQSKCGETRSIVRDLPLHLLSNPRQCFFLNRLGSHAVRHTSSLQATLNTFITSSPR